MFTPAPDYHIELRDDPENPGQKVEVQVCDNCGTVRFVGDWMYCPHGKAHFGEEPLEPYVDEHIREGGTDVGVDAAGNHYLGTLITTRGQRAQIMREQGLEYRKKRTDLLPSTRSYFFGGGR